MESIETWDSNRLDFVSKKLFGHLALEGGNAVLGVQKMIQLCKKLMKKRWDVFTLPPWQRQRVMGRNGMTLQIGWVSWSEGVGPEESDGPMRR